MMRRGFGMSPNRTEITAVFMQKKRHGCVFTLFAILSLGLLYLLDEPLDMVRFVATEEAEGQTRLTVTSLHQNLLEDAERFVVEELGGTPRSD